MRTPTSRTKHASWSATGRSGATGRSPTSRRATGRSPACRTRQEQRATGRTCDRAESDRADRRPTGRSRTRRREQQGERATGRSAPGRTKATRWSTISAPARGHWLHAENQRGGRACAVSTRAPTRRTRSTHRPCNPLLRTHSLSALAREEERVAPPARTREKKKGHRLLLPNDLLPSITNHLF